MSFILLFVLAVLSGFAGFSIILEAETTIFQEIMGGILLVCATIFFTGSCIVEVIFFSQRKANKIAESSADSLSSIQEDVLILRHKLSNIDIQGPG